MNGSRWRSASLVLLLLFVAGLAIAPPAAPGHAAPPASGAVPLHVAAATPTSTAAPLSSPTGFFTSRTLPLPPLANRTCALVGLGTGCPSGYLLNLTNDVAMNYSSKGVLAVAYTAFTNEVPCASAAPYAQSVVSVALSRNNGSTWSSPEYLSNPDCKSAGIYPSAWQPAITSLSNGTLVLAYIEYNSSSVLPFVSPYYPPLSRLVFTESYDGGGNWTAPTVLNSSVVPTLTGVEFPELLPSISAVGRTIYLGWMSLAVYSFSGGGTTSHVSLLVSTNGGRYWSPVLPLAALPYSNAENPYVLATRSGVVYVAYSQGLPGQASVLVDSSNDNYTSFVTNTVSYAVSPIPLTGPFSAPAPRLAYAASSGVLYVGFVGGATNLRGREFAAPWLYSSTDGGVLWTQATGMKTLFFDPLKAIRTGSYGNPYSNTGVYDLELAVTSNGTLELEAMYENGTLCWNGSCGYLAEYAASSTDGGASFTGPFEINGTLSANPSGWPGEYAAVVASGSHLWLASPMESCPFAPALPCGDYPTAPIPTTQLLVAEPASGPGLTATFTASGLNATTPWQVDLMGHVATGVGTSTLTFKGLPPGEPLFWTVPGLNVTSSLREYVTAQSSTPIVAPSANFTDLVTFSGFVPVTEAAVPAGLFVNALLPGCLTIYQYTNSWDAYVRCANVNLTPYAKAPAHWVELGVPFTMNASTWDPLYTDCYAHASVTYVFCSISITNFTFISWSGTGAGSVNSSGMNITVRPLGAVTEVANYLETGDCSGDYQSYSGHVYSNVNCARFTVPLGFSERGLPAGTPWGVSLAGADGNFTNVS
ncbi:MAG: glycoside hydrolase, partial [Thermoplasmata archaeon]|nr:glycoside hydrolase [Thermoplasmata archaeon]